MDLTNVLEIARHTDVGKKRDHNEDAVASDIESGLVVLADGMGGYNAGEVASEIAVLSIVADLKEAMLSLEPGQVDAVTGYQLESQLIYEAAAKANQAIYQTSQNNPQCAGMGTTLVVGLFTNNRLLVGHIGDSRMYRLRGEEFKQITEDHSLLQEQIKSGLISVEEAKVSSNKNLVTRALGIDPTVELELHEYPAEVGDIYLLCSDGLSDMVTDDDIQSTLTLLSSNLELASEQLINMANDHGGKDNISAILVKVNKAFGAEKSWYDNFLKWLK